MREKETEREKERERVGGGRYIDLVETVVVRSSGGS